MPPPAAPARSGGPSSRAVSGTTLLEGLPDCHLDPGDDATDGSLDLLDGLVADLAGPLEGPRRRGRRGFLSAEPHALGAGDRTLDGVPRHEPNVPADLGGALDEHAGARADRASGLGADFLGAFEDADDPALGRRAQVATDLGGAHDRTTQDVGDRRGERRADRTRALDGADQRAADRVDNGGHNLTGALDRPDQGVLDRFHDPFVNRSTHLRPPSGDERHLFAPWAAAQYARLTLGHPPYQPLGMGRLALGWFRAHEPSVCTPTT